MIVALVPSYLGWHYTRGLLGVVSVGGDILWFTAHFFSVPLLLRTFISPWKRMEERGREGDIEDFFAALIVNVFSRAIGVLIRSVVIIAGLFALFLTLLSFLLCLVLWVLAPVLAVASTVFGITLLVS